MPLAPGDALQRMEILLTAFESMVPPPKRVTFRDGFVFRYAEKSLHQAMVQKLARVISGISAATLLLQNGFLQEHAAIQRMLDEFCEDVAFLCFAAIDGEMTDLHHLYLEEFYTEELDVVDGVVALARKRGMIPRKRIRAYITNRAEYGPDPSTRNAQLTTIAKAYSGYVHGASAQVMEMYGGNPPKFHVRGMRQSPLFADHAHDIWNYYYRGIVTFGMAAKAFGSETIVAEALQLLREFEDSSPERAPNDS